MNEADRAAIIASAGRLGLSPAEWGGLMHYESGLDPTRWGGAGGRHVGIIQFGPAEQRQFGVTGNETLVEQLPKAEAFMLSRGYQPGMGLMQAYSTVNAGSPGRLDASDAGNGGMPGTVADKVNTQFASHIEKTAALLGDSASAPAPTMTVPGEPSGPGAYGLSGPTPVGAPFSLAPAGGAAMTTPTPASADDGPRPRCPAEELGRPVERHGPAPARAGVGRRPSAAPTGAPAPRTAVRPDQVLLVAADAPRDRLTLSTR